MKAAKSLGYKIWSFHSKVQSQTCSEFSQCWLMVEALACSLPFLILFSPLSFSCLSVSMESFLLPCVVNRLSWLLSTTRGFSVCISSEEERVAHRCLYLIPQVCRNRTPYDSPCDTRGRQDSSCAEDAHQFYQLHDSHFQWFLWNTLRKSQCMWGYNLDVCVCACVCACVLMMIIGNKKGKKQKW